MIQGSPTDYIIDTTVLGNLRLSRDNNTTVASGSNVSYSVDITHPPVSIDTTIVSDLDPASSQTQLWRVIPKRLILL